jgi:hypothetical protein
MKDILEIPPQKRFIGFVVSITMGMIFFLLLANQVKGQAEISLYNSNGNAVAYIATEDDNTIYLWNGKPVAYLFSDGDDIHVYGFNGKHLGWYMDGIIRDHKGDVVGFEKGAVNNIYLNYEDYKGYKDYKPYKGYREYAPYKPYWSSDFSNTPFPLFLQLGTDENGSTQRIFKSSPPVMETDLDLLEKVNLQKEKIYDQRAEIVQNVINQIASALNQIKTYVWDSAFYKNGMKILINNITVVRLKYEKMRV